MANAPRKPPATYDDVLAAPENLVAEIIDGELSLMPRPSPKHSLAAHRLASGLEGKFGRGGDGPGGWLLLVEPDLHLFGKKEPMVPDLAGWRLDRMPELPETAWFEVRPDWVCEVLSPKTATYDRMRKLPAYARAGVSHAWLVDPIVRLVEIYRLDGETFRYLGAHEGDDRMRAEPFAGGEIELGRLWGV